MRLPLVSIGIPTYNRPKELEHIINIACEQTYRNLDIIIVDNCSTDPEVSQVISAAQKRDKRVRSYRNTENVGVLKNAKLALDAANGEYFCWFSDDDWRAPEFIETLLGLLEQSPEVHMAFCDYREITDDLHLAQGYLRSHRQGLHYFTHNSPTRRILEYYWQDQKDGKCNIFYSLFRRASLLKLNFEQLSQGFTLLSMDNYIAMSMVRMSKLSFQGDVLCALTCSNEKHYLNESMCRRLTQRSGIKLYGFVREAFYDLQFSKRIAEDALTCMLLNCMFLPKLMKEVFLRGFRKFIPVRKQKQKEEIAVQRVFQAEVHSDQSVGKSAGRERIHIPNVTLIAIATKDVEKTALALRYSRSEIDFGAVKMLSHYRPWNIGRGIEYSRIRPFNNVDDWGRFIIYDLHQHVETEFILLIHADGFVVNPESWHDRFLRYDYIGAPWPIPRGDISYRDDHGTLYRVGNSVSIRSKKLLELPGRLSLPWEPFHGLYNEDGFLCVKHHKILEEHGIRFGELEDARFFAHEKALPENKGIRPFCFHKWAETIKDTPHLKHTSKNEKNNWRREDA